MLRKCILNTKNQSFKDFNHTINIMYDNESEIANYECDVLSSHISSQLNNYFLSKGNYRSLGGYYPNNNYLMPMTFAFSRKAYEILLDIKDDYNHDDLQWRTAWSNCGLKDQNVDNSNNII